MIRRSPPRRRVRGFSLIELAVALVVLGLVSMVLVRFLGTALQERRDTAGRDLLQRADDALLAFVMSQGRLPCPARTAAGTEDCGAGQVGLLPYRTLGLPDANARRIRYGVFRRPDAAAATRDADLAQATDRLHILQVLGGRIGTTIPLGRTNGLDLCWALRTAQAAPTSADYLHVTRPDAPTTVDRNVAYALALPAPGEAFGGQQATTRPAFDSPYRRSGPMYRDRVAAVGLDQLWGRMRCGDHLSANGHAHFNTAASIALFHQSLVDYEAQLEITKQMADANVRNAEAAVASAASGLLGAAGGVADATSEGLASSGAMAYKVALAAIATGAGVGVQIQAALLLSDARSTQTAAEARLDEIEPLIDAADDLEPIVLQNARDGDRAGLYAPPP